ncbi:hypothetical protein WR25_23516 [Diploscapter pachys]|uniref:Armadillo repeat-containing domain-containing protein n=1 Tax=Diploscapter pachys TaxID=2018661 RepID=A0A2A2KUU8_9BILA|nr:hypothetical protein WR25_23516 [Diploscapter pachys]
MQICLETIRRLITGEQGSRVIDEMIQHDLMKVLVNALKINDQAILFKAATSCVTIAAGNHAQTKALVDAGAAEALVRLINIPDHDVAKQALWAVSNIVADAQEFRDAVIECHGIDAMVELSRHINNISTPFARTLSWAYSNMCFFNNHPFIPQEELRKLIKGIHLLVDYDDIEVEGDALKAIVWATEHSDDVRELVVQSELLEITHNKLSGQESSNLKWTINILVNIAKGNHHFRQVIIDSGFLREISTLVGKDDVDESVIKESIWLISKISYGSDDQIQAIFNAGLIPFVRKALDNTTRAVRYCKKFTETE